MSTTISCYIANSKVIINDNSVKTENSSLQIELVKRLIECKALTNPTDSALPLFYNKFLRHYPITSLEFIENKKQSYKIENWENTKKIAA